MKWLLRGTVGLFGAWIVFSIGLVTAIILYGNRDGAHPADAIIVLGAGIEADGSPSKTLMVRATHGADLWKQGIAPVVLCTGGVIGSAPRSEAEACEDVLMAEGVPAESILSEYSSINTAGNVFFTNELMQQNGMDTAVVVSSRYHMLRARWLYWRTGVPVTSSPAEIGYLTTGEILFSYTREWAAFHWQVLRDWFDIPHIVVPVP
ncbi:MAG: YdcF family protein [Chloroflexota bacterium]